MEAANKLVRNLMTLAALVAVSACTSPHYLVKTPSIYSERETGYETSDIAEADKTATPAIYFFTDRSRNQTEKPEKTFGPKRSNVMVFGKAETVFDRLKGWPHLVSISSSARRPNKVPLRITSVGIEAEFPPTPFGLARINGATVVDPKVLVQFEESASATQSIFRQELFSKKTDEVLLYVHGYNTNFRDSILNLLDIWHFAGRRGLPISYTWPAAHGGLTGYFADSESGEFSIFHLKQALRLLMGMPELKRINIIAHSRGTVLISTAIRELVIEARAAGKDLKSALKIHNLILAAPDMDYGVVQQRLVAEQLEEAHHQITVYTNEDDVALSLSSFLASAQRFGKLRAEDVSEKEQQMLALVEGVAFVRVADLSSFIGHSYYRKNPRALSDIAALIRYEAPAGSPLRPLESAGPSFWVLPKEYYPEPK
ncbi:MAG: alpha/beta hydrolase [Kordiimonadaceae bacterium]|nr:alpha/beta hydrolase [Kordiimonadaceae bacterium]MBO6568588.1 alpha/beta hydrolase [Kordiimonadaceae bacterium]MBO6965436.1 alpha/beta hydrolase [Kordiimonadaceae bacterium]